MARNAGKSTEKPICHATRFAKYVKNAGAQRRRSSLTISSRGRQAGRIMGRTVFFRGFAGRATRKNERRTWKIMERSPTNKRCPTCQRVWPVAELIEENGEIFKRRYARGLTVDTCQSCYWSDWLSMIESNGAADPENFNLRLRTRA